MRGSALRVALHSDGLPRAPPHCSSLSVLHSFSEGGQHSTTPFLRRAIIQHLLGSSFRKFLRMSFFEANALENGRADIASYKGAAAEQK